MTYRHYIQEQIRQLSDLFDESSRLRDAAALDEKQHWNKHRDLLNQAMYNLSRLDNRLPDGRAQMDLDT